MKYRYIVVLTNTVFSQAWVKPDSSIAILYPSTLTRFSPLTAARRKFSRYQSILSIRYTASLGVASVFFSRSFYPNCSFSKRCNVHGCNDPIFLIDKPRGKFHLRTFAICKYFLRKRIHLNLNLFRNCTFSTCCRWQSSACIRRDQLLWNITLRLKRGCLSDKDVTFKEICSYIKNS